MLTVSARENTSTLPCGYKVDGTPGQIEAIRQVIDLFSLNKDQLTKIIAQFVDEMGKGLDHDGATVAMIPSFVPGKPTGKETGTYLALDLGGTNLRVCKVVLLGDGKYDIHQRKYVVSETLKRGKMHDLCDFIAECVGAFLSEQHTSTDSERLKLGFTFSFPIFQTSMNRGVLKQWTKGFACSGAVGKDAALMLQEALHKKHINVDIVAIVNDTVGTLMAHAYQEPDTMMGVIMGTGANISYCEKIANITKWKQQDHGSAEEMAINMECGAFDCERRVLPVTVYDQRIDRQSLNVHEQQHEKMIAGMYLGEITRQIMLDMIDRRLLFGGRSSSELNRQWSFDTAYMSTIEKDTSAKLLDTGHILESIMNIPSTALADRQMVKIITTCVGRRAARLHACGLAGVMTQTRKLDTACTIAVDGSLFEFYPNFEKNIMDALVEIYGPKMKDNVKFALSRDGSGLGAAVVAMMAHKHTQK
ncbi:uncharacterized protein BYT42DRAFT_491468 [Radiomyces spectabilis]|uniref:uncharacterized protein n=1 Tax=Radiomyces spectabilis TaxID=64574 RepID=UPI002220C5C0|nr:uncharacterized protein BYT42DRAFT_491468 [Radiomyces spectabilis]KAI8388245.1 hypothetical protein BYT42DRAFT_491468 [Radiomyces spectabilis]